MTRLQHLLHKCSPDRGPAAGPRFRGFTLIETSIVIAISTLVTLALANLFGTFYTLYGYQQGDARTAGSAIVAMTALQEAILPSDAVLASRAFSGVTYTSTTTSIALKLPSIDSSGTVIANTYDYVAFYGASTTLYRLTEAGVGSARISGTKTLSTTLDSIAFTYDSADFTQVGKVGVDMTMRAVIKQAVVESRLKDTFYLRN